MLKLFRILETNRRNYMDDNRRPSRSSSSSSASSSNSGNQCRSLRRQVDDEEAGDAEVACTGRSCESCTAGAIADCVALCCCPCSVVNFLALALVRLPWAVARKCLDRRRKRNRRRRLEEKRERKCCEGGSDWNSANGDETTSDAVLSAAVISEGLNDLFSAEFKLGDFWSELYKEVQPLDFGRVSFSGIPFQDKGN
ncbi:hypothetical protein OROGR_023508 [Orobanche gracilis]